MLEQFPHAQFHPTLTFPLHNEHDEHGHTIPGDASWIALTEDGKTVSEGKFFRPEESTDQSHLIIFTPGMPGNGFSTFVERRFVSPLLKKGASCLVLRHLGTWLDGTAASQCLACPERSTIGRRLHQKNIGEQKSYDVDDLVSEITAPLHALGPSFERITLIAHSSGALGEVLALQDIPQDIQQKIRHVISLAGLVGGIDHLQWWLRSRILLTLYFWDCQRAIRLKSPNINIRKLQDMFHTLFQEKIPAHIMPIFIHAPGDELIRSSASELFHAHNNRGLYLIDHTQTSYFHKLPNLQPETLLRLLDIYHPKTKHTWNMRKKEVYPFN